MLHSRKGKPMPELRIPTPFRDGNQIFSRFDTERTENIRDESSAEEVKRLKAERDRIDALIEVCDKADAIAFQKIITDRINDLAQSAYAIVMCAPPDYIREQNIGYIRGLADVKDVRSVLKDRYDKLSARIKELRP